MTPGTQIGPYEILSLLGAGGMGEVYRAKDSTLKREVALKVLPADVAKDRERLARFQREAEVLASLNHPHIAQIYGLERADDTIALVMELVEGEDLAQRIARGPIPLGEALPIASQIAEALEAAHGCGIIHRDLKPANIKVRRDGAVKVLDFGLAKAIDPTAGSSATAMNSPTLSIHATQAGIILGTAAYMSPEQASGKAVDKRSDLWAFGVVLLEMLTGRPVFSGETVSHVLAAVLRAEPDWIALPANTPAPIRRLLRRCLDKDRKRRLADAADARLEIDDALAGSSSTADSVAASRGTELRSAWSRALPWAVAGICGVALLSALLVWSPWRAAPVFAPRELLASIGADASLPTSMGASAVLSPDGTTLVFAAQRAGQTRLFLRKLNQLHAAELAGTDGAANPFFSPNGQWVAFFAGGRLKKVSASGGATIDLSAAADNRGGAWTDDDSIIFMPTRTGALVRVSAAGGTPALFGTLSKGAMVQRWPQTLPGGKGVLYTEHSSTDGFDGAHIMVAALNGGTSKVVVRGGYYGRYLPSGHLIYLQQGTLFAIPFDLARLETTGPAAPALEGLTANPISGGAQLAFSLDGTLVYLPGSALSAKRPIDWMTRDGKTAVLRTTQTDWRNPRFSPDGQKLAFQIRSDGAGNAIWVYEWARDTATQLTFDSSQNRLPVWTPDGRRIVFTSDRAQLGISNLYWRNADGTGEITRLTEDSENQFAASWHPSGKFLALSAGRGARGSDLMMLPMEGDADRGWTPGKSTVFLSTPAIEVDPMFSPDGRWIAYSSDETGLDNVYVRPFPGSGGPWRVSTEGGAYPRWSAAAHELLFVHRGNIMVVSFAVVGDSFRADKPQIWSPTGVVGVGSSPYELHPDGKRLATVAARDQELVVQDKVVFFLNFFDYLRTIAPGTR